MTQLEEYQIQRDDFHKEHELVSNRTTWFVTSQSFLVTAFVLAPAELKDVRRLIPFLGASIALFTFAAVIAAVYAMKDLRVHIHRLVGDPELKNLPGWGRRKLNFWGMAPPFVIPVLFFALWIYCILR